MDAKTLTRICTEIYRKFPEVKGVTPRQHPQTGDTLLLVFQGMGKAVDGRPIPRVVRVTVDGGGKILKTSTSR